MNTLTTDEEIKRQSKEEDDAFFALIHEKFEAQERRRKIERTIVGIIWLAALVPCLITLIIAAIFG